MRYLYYTGVPCSTRWAVVVRKESARCPKGGRHAVDSTQLVIRSTQQTVDCEQSPENPSTRGPHNETQDTKSFWLCSPSLWRRLSCVIWIYSAELRSLYRTDCCSSRTTLAEQVNLAKKETVQSSPSQRQNRQGLPMYSSIHDDTAMRSVHNGVPNTIIPYLRYIYI